MHPKQKQNLLERTALVAGDLLQGIDQDIKAMFAEHSSAGLLASGATIKRTMDFIAKGNERLYQEVLDHLLALKPRFHGSLESEVQGIAAKAQEGFKQEALSRLRRSTEVAKFPDLFDKVLPDVEAEMANDLAVFQNSLAAIVLDLKLNSGRSALAKALWVMEGALLLASMFIAGMWYNNPAGNYEPVLVGLALIISLVGVGIKIGSNR